nr:T9SS type A sorting domain-containing protein [Bacteroidales bacterium]
SPGTIENNSFVNNRVGICAYANSPDIIGNYFTGNEIAVASHASSTPRLVGGAFGNIPYYNGLIDNDTAIAIYNSLPKVKNGKNDIYNSSRGVYMIFTDDFPDNKLNVSNNYYGSSDTAVVIAHFIPSNKFTISPLLDTAQTNFKQLTLDPYEELPQQAFYQFEQQQYVPAAQMFQQFIMQYPDNYLALYAVPGEYLCYMYGEMLWDDFVQNMEHVLQDSLINTSIEKYAFEYKNLALRNKGDFATAIDNYENMLNQPVSYYDSLYAAINLAHTILESGLYKSSAIISGLDRQLIADNFSHVVRTKELLFSVPKDVNAFDPGKNCLNIINLHPNPAHHSFSIDFSACESGSMLIELYSVNGRKVYQKMLNHKSGINQFTFDIAAEEGKKINPGLYIVKLSSGSSETTEKVMLW